MPKSKRKSKKHQNREKRDFAETAFAVFKQAMGIKQPRARRPAQRHSRSGRSRQRPARTEAKDGGRRFTRLTNGFSKKLENHEHALALYFMHYNFCRIHQTLGVTSAMEAGITDHVWSLDEVIDLP